MNSSQSHQSVNVPVKRVVIAGGGTAGWITAAVLSKALGDAADITLVESDAIPTVGVGEATIPPLQTLHEMLELSEQEFMAKTNATFKLGIAFENWRDKGQDYIHSFGFAGRDNWVCKFYNYWLSGKARGLVGPYGDYCTEHLASRENKFAKLSRSGLNYAYHLDAGLYAKLLREFSESKGVLRKEGKITGVKLSETDGAIESLQLESGDTLAGDLFVDCTGFRSLLLGEALQTEYIDWSHWLPCDRALAVQTESVRDPIPYTRSIAHDSGWQWQIPLQNRVGNGLVYCSRYLSDDAARELLLSNLDSQPINQPKPIRFTTGTRARHWSKNCVAIGLSSGFLEPLESTSIHLIQRAATHLAKYFPSEGIAPVTVSEFNRTMRQEVDYVRDFIILHYKVTERRDSDFWNDCRTMDIPETLQSKIDLFHQTGRIFKRESELFGDESWFQVMIGQGLMPRSWHPLPESMGDAKLSDFLDSFKTKVARDVQQLPPHRDFINYYCKADAERKVG